MSKLFTRATVSGATLAGSGQKSVNTGLWDALNTAGLTDSTRTTVTTTSTLLTTQCGLLLVDCTSGSITLTLPTSGATTDDAVYNIRRIDSGSNTLSVQRGGTDTIEGATTALSVVAGGVLGIQMPAGATNWRVFNQSNVASQDSRAQTQAATAFTSAGTQPNYTLTPSPAITSLVSGQRFRVKVHAANSGATSTLVVNGLASTGIKQYDALGNKVDPTLAAGQLVDVEYDGTHWVAIDPLPATMDKIQPITASVGGSALTVTINPTTLDFRSNPITSGTVNTRAITSAISVVVPSTATLGTVSGVRSRLAVLALDFSGTVEAAVVNTDGGFDLSETGLISTTTVSSGATSASVAYSTTGRTTVPYRVVGYLESTQATAGTWVTSPSLIQGVGGRAYANLITSGSAVTLSSQTSVTFTGIPAWAKRVRVILRGATMSGADQPVLRIGSGSLQTTGYNSNIAAINGGTGQGTLASGHALQASAAVTCVITGTIEFVNLTGNVWVSTGLNSYLNNGSTSMVTTDVSLSGSLDRVALTTVGGAVTFTAGTINITYE